MKIDEILAILEQQEDLLRFTEFNHEDAWKLGSYIVSKMQENRFPVAVSIRMANELVLFQYVSDGANSQSLNWIRRKHHTVMTTERSSLHAGMSLRKKGKTLADWYLDPMEYAIDGGAFPIRIKDSAVIGSIIVSGLDQFADHNWIVRCLEEHLDIKAPHVKKEDLEV